MKLLHLDSSLLGEQSVSRELSASIVRAWHAAVPGLEVTYRDLHATPPPQLTGEVVRVLKLGASNAGDSARRTLAEIESLLAEFLAADAIVIGAPMYNFSIPVPLKAWIDALAQPGRTFAYTPQGPRGLAGGKRVVIASSRGNVYSQPPMTAKDFQEPYLSAVLGFMGVTDIQVVRAEGVSRSPEMREAAVVQAHKDISALFDKQVVAA